MDIPKETITRVHNERLACDLRIHIKQHGWQNTAKVLREVVSVCVGWDSYFTELDNVLRQIVKKFSPPDTTISPSSHLSQEPDIPDSELEPPASHFS